ARQRGGSPRDRPRRPRSPGRGAGRRDRGDRRGDRLRRADDDPGGQACSRHERPAALARGRRDPRAPHAGGLRRRRPQGGRVRLPLAERADVFAQNFRPGVVEDMGFGYEALRERNPRLVYCNISGFGMRPPGSDFPGFDQTAQAMSGLMSVTGTAATGPLRVGIAVADSSTGVFAAVGVLAALLERERSGVGQEVDASLLESMLTLLSYQAQKYLSLGEIPGQDGNDHPLMFPQGTFAARDGMLTLASGNEKMWA